MVSTRGTFSHSVHPSTFELTFSRKRDSNGNIQVLHVRHELRAVVESYVVLKRSWKGIHWEEEVTCFDSYFLRQNAWRSGGNFLKLEKGLT